MADYMQAPRRNALLGVLADAAQSVDDYAQRPDSTMPMGKANALLSVLSRFAGVPAVASTLDRLSYGDSLTTGTGQTLRVRPEVVEAAMAAAPVVSAAGKMAGRGANALADASVRAITGNPQATAVNALAYARGMAPVNPLTVWHGSPHKFDRFDSSKIGTGEGAQAYGHGLYLAESPDVAAGYREALSKTPNISYVTKSGSEIVRGDKWHAADIANFMKERGIDPKTPEGSEWLSSEIGARYMGGSDVTRADVMKMFRSGVNKKSEMGALYKVDLPDEVIAKMLDWDKPLSQQAPEVASALKSMVNDVTSGGFDLSRGNRNISKAFNPTTREQVLSEIQQNYPHLSIVDGGLVDKSGHKIPEDAITEWMQNKHGIGYQDAGQLYRDLTHIVGSDAYVSSVLRNNGIPGIRYLDGGSRGAGGGTSNFVIFPGEENALTILERNGKPVR